MICNHVSAKRRTQGQQDNCILCNLPIIVNSNDEWVWIYGLSDKERKQLTIVYNVNRLIGGLNG